MRNSGCFERRRWSWGLVAVAGLVLAWQLAAYGQGREGRPGGPGPRPECPLPGGTGPHGPQGEGRPGPPPGGAFGSISPQQTEELMQFVEEHFPRRHRMLSRLRERNPEAFERHIAGMAPRVLELLLRMKENPELGELMLEQQRLEEELREVVRSYHTLQEDSEAESDQAKNRLEELVGRLVDIRLQRRLHEITALERRLERQRHRLEQDQERREELVAEELERVLERRFGRRQFRGLHGERPEP